MDKCIIFGCGKTGMAAYRKIREIYKVIAWSDTDPDLWGTEKYHIPVIPPTNLPSYCTAQEGLDVIITSSKYHEIARQLASMDIRDILVWHTGFLYDYDGYLYPSHRWGHKIISKESAPSKCENVREKPNVLFVQKTASFQADTLARSLKEKGYGTYLLYTLEPPICPDEADGTTYDNVFTVFSMSELIQFVNEGEFDIVHGMSSSREVMMLLVCANKPVFFDCTDAIIDKQKKIEELLIEQIVCKKSAGIIYPTENERTEAIKRFCLMKDRTLVFSANSSLQQGCNITGLIAFYEYCGNGMT